MNHAVCIDASIAAKWVLAEEDSDAAEALLAEVLFSGETLVAPLHFQAEVTSAIYKHLRAGAISLGEAQDALAELELTAVRLRHTRGLAQRAIELGDELHLKYPYDALYLALAEALDCDAWTADRQFWNAARAAHPRLRLLAEYRPRAARSGR